MSRGNVLKFAHYLYTGWEIRGRCHDFTSDGGFKGFSCGIGNSAKTSSGCEVINQSVAIRGVRIREKHTFRSVKKRGKGQRKGSCSREGVHL